ncbi:MAG TPA: glycosyltransferase [Burkholderiaceae bacterium]|nr:glycosyltransferase [Burkholderiaceae bacterium]
MLISVIVTTYNRPDALRAVMAGLCAQRDRGFEVLVADDGSGPETAQLLAGLIEQAPMRILHVWQEDRGFRAAAARNRAAEQARGQYFIFLDGDCVPRADWIAKHRALAQVGWMVAGNRALLSESLTVQVLAQGLSVHAWPMRRWAQAVRRGQLNRLGPLLYLPLGPLRRAAARRWQRVRTCNLGVWRDDFFAVGGFDESFEGWGFEDSDLAVRLLNLGVRRKEGAWATGVLHLWHRENDRAQEGINWTRLQQRLRSGQTQAERGCHGP